MDTRPSSRRSPERSRSSGDRKGITQTQPGATGRERKDSARRWFDRRAGSYEGGFTSRWRESRPACIAGRARAHSRAIVLDLGCGTGAASRAAAAIAGSVVGVDSHRRSIRGGGRSCRRHRERSVRDRGRRAPGLRRGSLHGGPVLELLPSLPWDSSRAVAEMRRVLSVGGRLVIGDACADLVTARIADRFLRRFEPGHVRLHRSAELGSYLQANGFSEVALRRLSGGGFVAIVRGVAG